MMPFIASQFMKTTVPTLVLAVVMAGCSKKTEEPAAVVPPTEGAAATAPAAGPSAAEIAESQRMFAEADAALKAREYQKAVESLLAAQQKRLTDEQSAQSRNRMIQLQSSLASAAASGDPNALAAIQRLRASATYR